VLDQGGYDWVEIFRVLDWAAIRLGVYIVETNSNTVPSKRVATLHGIHPDPSNGITWLYGQYSY
jgi:hypothetical protein